MAKKAGSNFLINVQTIQGRQGVHDRSTRSSNRARNCFHFQFNERHFVNGLERYLNITLESPNRRLSGEALQWSFLCWLVLSTPAVVTARATVFEKESGYLGDLARDSNLVYLRTLPFSVVPINCAVVFWSVSFASLRLSNVTDVFLVFLDFCCAL